MRLQDPFGVVTAGVDGAVLGVLAGCGAAGGFTGRGVARAVGRFSSEGVRRSLFRLVAQGVVDVEDLGSAKRYQLNRDHLAAPHLEAIAGLYDTFIERLTDRLATWEPRACFAALFGPAARGEMGMASGIDVFVVRPDNTSPDTPPWATQRTQLTLAVSRWTGNTCRILEASAADTRHAVANNEAVLADIAHHGIPLLGDPTYLRHTAPPPDLGQ